MQLQLPVFDEFLSVSLYKLRNNLYNRHMMKVYAASGPAKRYGLKKGDSLLEIDSYPVVDELDYLYADSKDKFTLLVEREGNRRLIEVEKESEEPFGLTLVPNEAIRTCHNHCIFCFVDQMPPGMRESLYVKDDDYTMSFACGNFVTLTNLSEADLDRIIRLKLSPLYISVHTMNPQLRCELLRNRFAGRITEQIERLAQAGITMHTQAVIVPQKNDGAELEHTARTLFRYYPQVKDLAVVPTGITKYREGLTYIPDVDGAYADEFLTLVERLNTEFGVPFLLPADEYFIKSGRAFLPASFYGEFEQIENGIGMTTKFLSEFFAAVHDVALKRPKRSLLVSGVSAKQVNETVCRSAMEHIHGLQADVLAIPNRFFGETVTCTGLLTGVDILQAIQTCGKEFDEIVLPGNTMREFEEVFLCGMTLKELKKKLKFNNIRINRQGGEGLFSILSTEK